MATSFKDLHMFKDGHPPVVARSPEQEQSFSKQGYRNQYIHQAWPICLYHATKGEKNFGAAEYERALADGWQELPIVRPAAGAARERPVYSGLNQNQGRIEELEDQVNMLMEMIGSACERLSLLEAIVNDMSAIPEEEESVPVPAAPVSEPADVKSEKKTVGVPFKTTVTPTPAI